MQKCHTNSLAEWVANIGLAAGGKRFYCALAANTTHTHTHEHSLFL